MTLYGLRLLVALLTFAVGVSAAWLFNCESAPVAVERDVTTVAVLGSLEEAPPPPRRACRLERGPIVSGGILQGKAVSKPQPAYPAEAKAAGVSGTVVVQVIVGEDGSVVEAEAVRGPELLRDAAVEAAREARFSPTRLSGQPVRVSGVITYRFVLD
jgi:TonB family protein